MNRSQRRQEAKLQRSKKYADALLKDQAVTKEINENLRKEVERLQGMTGQDLINKARTDGFRDGLQNAAKPIIRRYYAATMMALHDLYGFDQMQIITTINRIEEVLIETLTDLDLADKILQDLSIEIDMTEGLNRAQPASERSLFFDDDGNEILGYRKGVLNVQGVAE